MTQPPISRGFRGRRPDGATDRLPPGQHLTSDFPVLSAGPTPETDLKSWSFSLYDGVTALAEWSWPEFETLPQTSVKVDIHCVTKWSKLDTHWQGVTIDKLLEAAGLSKPPTSFSIMHSDGDYSTNIPVEDLIGGKAMVATSYEGEPLAPEHGGPKAKRTTEMQPSLARPTSRSCDGCGSSKALAVSPHVGAGLRVLHGPEMEPGLRLGLMSGWGH